MHGGAAVANDSTVRIPANGTGKELLKARSRRRDKQMVKLTAVRRRLVTTPSSEVNVTVVDNEWGASEKAQVPSKVKEVATPRTKNSKRLQRQEFEGGVEKKDVRVNATSGSCWPKCRRVKRTLLED